MNQVFLGLANRVVGILPDPSYTEATNQALINLRSLDHFQWYVVPIFVLVFYMYFSEIEKKNWNVVMAGLAFWGLEWFFEILNAIFLYVHGTSAIWTTPCLNTFNTPAGIISIPNSALILTVGLNIEITLMFAFMGIVFAKVLPKNKKTKIMGIPNRVFFAFFNAILCVVVEIGLNRWDALIWEYWWWNWTMPLFIIIIGYSLYMFFSFWVHDMPSMKKKLAVVSSVYVLDIVCLILFMGILKWI
jgi:hypothetical protein